MGSEEHNPTTATVVETPRGRREQTVHTAAPRVGHFQLLESIGEGGMGAVYAAYDLRLDRKVAIKLLREDVDDQHAERRNQRLLREAQAMAKLSHPNVVPVYEVGFVDESVFIAMEYIAGKTLGQWIADDKPAWDEIVGAFVQAARGLAAAHEAGIVHRDFKPDNVLLDERGHVRVTDFGIALMPAMSPRPASMDPSAGPVDGEDGRTPSRSSEQLTEQGARVGTPAYMSPEQHRGVAVDARSDQFSFCIALYEALFGKRPFRGRGYELSDNVIHGRIDRAGEAGASVPSWVVAIALRGLQPEPDARFASMTELVDALARDPSRRRNRILVGGGLLAFTAAAVLVGMMVSARGPEACTGAEAHLATIWDEGVRAALDRGFAAANVPYAAASATRVETLLDDYRGHWIAMHVDACKATRTRREQSDRVLDLRMACLDRRRDELRALTAQLTSSPDAKTVEQAVDAASSLAPLAGCADTTALLAVGGAPADPAARARRAELRGRLDQLIARQRLGHDRETVAPLRALADEVEASHDPRLVAEVTYAQGALEQRLGDLETAEATLEAAMRLAHSVDDTDVFTAAAIALVQTLTDGGLPKVRESLGVVRVARAVVEHAHDPALAVRLLVAQGDGLMTLARPQEALPLLQAAKDQARTRLGDDHVLMLRVQLVLAPALAQAGKPAESRAEYVSLIAAATRILGALHPTTVTARINACRSLAVTQQLELAHTCFDAVMPDADRILGSAKRSVIAARVFEGMVLVDLGLHDAARTVLALAVSVVPADAWAEKWYIAADLLRELGSVEVVLGDYGSALDHCTRSSELAGKEHTLLRTGTCIGEALLGLGETRRAHTTLEELRAQLDGHGKDVGAWRFALARTAAASGQLEVARTEGEAARAELADAPAWQRERHAAWLAALSQR